jgi:hypothetical protein
MARMIFDTSMSLDGFMTASHEIAAANHRWLVSSPPNAHSCGRKPAPPSAPCTHLRYRIVRWRDSR